MSANPLKQTLADKVVAYFAPERALRRAAARVRLEMAGQWIGARTNRNATYNWRPGQGSADADTLADLPTLRDRCRDLERNNPISLGAINTIDTSAVGTGLMLRSRIDAQLLGLDDEDAQTWQRTAEREFRMWAENPSACDIERTSDFYKLQSIVNLGALCAGDIFATLPMEERRGSPYELKVQLIEADRVTNPDNRADSETLAGGIERDALGAPRAVHILRSHPGGLGMQKRVWDAVPMFGEQTGRRNVIHVFDKRRPSQSRGVPILAPVIESLKQLGDYTTAEITAAVVSGLFTVFVETPGGAGLGLDANGTEPASAPRSGDGVRLNAGAIVDLAQGEKVSFANPGRPNTAFDPFVQAVLRQIGAALQLPFELLVKHFTASYSASQAAFLEAWRYFRVRRQLIASMFCQPVYEAWMDEAVARGRLIAPGYFDDPAIRAAYLGAEWQGDSMGHIDPVKAVTAAEKRLALTLTTHAHETAEITGDDWESVIARRGRERELIERAGLTPAPANPSGAAPGSGAPPNPNDPANDPTDDPPDDEEQP